MNPEVGYPQVKEILQHMATGMSIKIEDAWIEDHIYFKGSVGEYFNSDVLDKELLFTCCHIENETLHVEALAKHNTKKEDILDGQL